MLRVDSISLPGWYLQLSYSICIFDSEHYSLERMQTKSYGSRCFSINTSTGPGEFRLNCCEYLRFMDHSWAGSSMWWKVSIDPRMCCPKELALTSCARHAVEASSIKDWYPRIPGIDFGLFKSLYFQKYFLVNLVMYVSLRHRIHQVILSNQNHGPIRAQGWGWSKICSPRFESGRERVEDKGWMTVEWP